MCYVRSVSSIHIVRGAFSNVFTTLLFEIIALVALITVKVIASCIADLLVICITLIFNVKEEKRSLFRLN